MITKKVEMSIIAITQARSSVSVYNIILEDTKTGRKVSMTIGANEAECILLGLEKMPLPRPLTHDLFRDFMKKVDASVTEVIIHKLDAKRMIFHAYIYIQRGVQLIQLDARPSDAIALAVRENVPVYMHEQVLEEAAGFSLKNSTEKESSKEAIHLLTLEELNERLKAAVEVEAYEEAIKIREEIKERGNKLPKL